MIAYNIDRNGYLLSEVLCQMSPREPGKYLIPRGAITTPLPCRKIENENFKWTGDKWIIVKDFSKKPYYNKKDKSVKWFKIEEDFDDNYTDKVPTSENTIFKDDEWVEDENLIELNYLKTEKTRLTKLLITLDMRSIRPLRTYTLYGNEEDKLYLQELEEQIIKERQTLSDITDRIKYLEEIVCL